MAQPEPVRGTFRPACATGFAGRTDEAVPGFCCGRKAGNMNDLNDASLGEVAHAWGSALPYEHVDARAAAALDACERRLRELHPYAMGIYDRLRKTRG